MRWQARVRPSVSGRLASSIELATTIFSATGVEPIAHLPKVNLLDDVPISRRVAIFGEIFTHNAIDIRDPASSSISLDDRWGLEVHSPRATGFSRGVIELYNLADDPLEIWNLSGKNPKKVAVLTKLIDGWWRSQR